jgi:hypothetical protein
LKFGYKLEKMILNDLDILLSIYTFYRLFLYVLFSFGSFGSDKAYLRRQVCKICFYFWIFIKYSDSSNKFPPKAIVLK